MEVNRLIYIDYRIEQQNNYIVFTYYELRIKMKMTKSETLSFLHIVRQKLEDKGYSIYTTGQKFYFNGTKIVEDNQLMVAVIN